MTNLSQHKVYEFEEFRLDSGTRLLFRNGEQLSLTPKAVETLIALVEGEGQVISKNKLMNKIWSDTVVEESNLAQYLHVLRKTLGETTDGKPYIETLKRRGYRFNGSVSVVANESRPSSERNTEDKDRDESTRTYTERQFSGSIERRGNLQAVRQLDPERETIPSVNVERSGNIYSVSDWRREPVADVSSPIPPQARSQWLSPVLLAVLVAVFAGIAFGIYKISTSGQNVKAPSVPFLGSDITRLTTTGRSKRTAISPDGRYVAHVTESKDGDSLFVRQTSIANDTRIAGPIKSDFAWITFAPDGNFVYYLTLDRDIGVSELFRVPVMGGPIVKVAHDIGAPTLSPDGSKLAYMVQNKDESRLIVATNPIANEVVSTSRDAPDYLYPNETVIVSRREPDYMNMYWFAPAWSLDGKSIAFPVNQSDENGRYETVLAVDVDTKVERKLTTERWQQVGQARWLADGLVVTASETSTGPNQLWHISLPDGTTSRITRDLNSYRHLSMTSDAKTLAFVQYHVVSNIWTQGEGGIGTKQLRSEAGWLNELIWLPDGGLAYTSNAGGNSDIWTISSDGSNVRQLTVGANARLGLSVTADGKQFIFAAEKDGKYNLWRVNIDGSDLTRITNGDGEFYPQITPDGNWIVYQSGGNYPTLRKMPITGGEPIVITKTTASRPTISPDGKFVAYHYLDSTFKPSRWGIGISSLEDGTRVKRFDFPSTVVERLVKWTRDGKGIAFLNSPGGVPNVWLQPIDGGEIKPLTEFTSDSIISFNWNADGSSLAVIRGVETSDVILLNR
ncbi:MAG TPA: winged helix-turn-helix domain-containing protein [Pyrinomonadaceae bacterium]|nr:winged helix-turn-helix domain-containing protein [Pyrinomonadaceae bacterium]